MDKADVVARMQTIKKMKNLTDETIGRAVGITKMAVNMWWNKRTTPDDKSVIRFLEYYEDISANWLLFGHGEMLRKDAKSIEGRTEELQKMLESKQKDLDFTRQLLERQDHLIKMLESKK